MFSYKSYKSLSLLRKDTFDISNQPVIYWSASCMCPAQTWSEVKWSEVKWSEAKWREQKRNLTCDLWLSCWLMARRSSSCCLSSTRASCFSQMSFSSIFMDSSISCFIPICTSSSFSTSCTEISSNFRFHTNNQEAADIKYGDRHNTTTYPNMFSRDCSSLSVKHIQIVSRKVFLRAWNAPVEVKFPLWAACVFHPALVRLVLSRFLMPEKQKQ